MLSVAELVGTLRAKIKKFSAQIEGPDQNARLFWANNIHIWWKTRLRISRLRCINVTSV